MLCLITKINYYTHFGSNKSVKEVTTSMHQSDLGPHFKTLNEAWLKKYFVIEPIDTYVLSHPDEITKQGGEIIYALIDKQVIGCAALKHQGNQVFELTKMAVTESHQAQGIGAVIMQRCIEMYHSLNGKKLYLETHSSLKPAIKLYARFGFIEKSHPFISEYQRSDYYMEYQGSNNMNPEQT